MKYLIAVCLSLIAISSRAQVTLEHVYPQVNVSEQFGIAEVDSGEWKYVRYNRQDSITLYNLDHSLDRVIIVPWSAGSRRKSLSVLARGLFTADKRYAYLLNGPDTTSSNWNAMAIIDEHGDSSFYCDSCYEYTTIFTPGMLFNSSIQATPRGTKMFIRRQFELTYEVYSLPGKLPGNRAKLGILDDPSLEQSSGFLPSSAYPNPSGGRVRITYELPGGITSGEILLLTTDGKEVRRYRVTNAFNDLLIDASDLPSGAYFYKLMTAKGESALSRIAIEK